jgi:hypothetical protein
VIAMTVPIWLGYLMLIAFSMALVGLGLVLIANAGQFLVNTVIPTIWINHKRMKIKNMSKEQLEDFIYAMRYDWTEEQMERGRLSDKSEKD